MIDFDNISQWSPSLSKWLYQYLPYDTEDRLQKLHYEYIEDVLDNLFSLSDKTIIIQQTIEWIKSSSLIGYHGSRLIDEDVANIKQNGLIPLKAEHRRKRLIRALSSHPNWDNIASLLDEQLVLSSDKGKQSGYREGQVHITLSCAGLTDSFNHYLTHGSEFDQHVAFALLGNEGLNLLANDGISRLIKVGVPGAIALETAHPFIKLEDMLDKGDLPNIVREILKAWSYRLVSPDFSPRTLRIDCGMIFFGPLPANWILDIHNI